MRKSREMETGGTLICVVGPSGAGKDTLINFARERLADDPRYVFPQRYISRGATPDEPHIPITEDECERRRRAEDFFLHWRAHGVTYALGRNVESALRDGKTMVANISRQMIGAARDRWPQTVVIHVTVDPQILRARLRTRGRESAEGVDARLLRGAEVDVRPAPWVFEFDNSEHVASTGPRFVALLVRLAQQRKALDETERPLAAGVAE
ncbi:MAG: phosphonate metabolism protein/1,5-bisphosphokinase (PRPP-forming) PhnN [Hyphomicrobiales bacterium]|nr:phosphonate metabolism protein/1,5-bisphosphokinase (PRPP-forming) PhnN [Hyphomicrobiales bacterium]